MDLKSAQEEEVVHYVRTASKLSAQQTFTLLEYVACSSRLASAGVHDPRRRFMNGNEPGVTLSGCFSRDQGSHMPPSH